MKVTAARTSTALSVLFLAVYGSCNWIASARAHAAWYFGWERRIPFVPIMIVPYLSIDALFVAAPFLCRDREELHVLARRVTVAILAAGGCFLTFPLQFAFDRPPVYGWLGIVFDTFTSLDRPFNLVPSLHIALCAILADTYARHTRGVVRGVSYIWFGLVGLSTLLTYQHHVVDVAGGLVLATLVFYCVRERFTNEPVVLNWPLGAKYSAGAAASACLAAAAWPWSSVTLIPALALAQVAAAYLGTGPAIFQKTSGRISIPGRLVLWPYLVGQWASFLYYRGRCRSWDEVAPGVLIGRRLSDREAAEMVASGVTAVLDLTAEFSEARPFRTLAYRNIQILDLTAPTLTQLQSATQFIREHAATGTVYVHCKIGYSRSAAVAGAYLLATGQALTSDRAVARLRAARPAIVIRREVLTVLREFEELQRRELGLRIRESGRGIRDTRDWGFGIRDSIAAFARLLCGSSPQWIGCEASVRQRVYFANHSSHLDFPLLWGTLPRRIRADARPVASRDYWESSWLRRYLATHVFRAVLVNRSRQDRSYDQQTVVAAARQSMQEIAAALGTDQSLIIFPEGTRGDGAEVRPFKSGLYYLCCLRPDVELVPVYLQNVNRILPKGAVLPVPVIASVTFGPPMHFQPGEEKDAFLARARATLVDLRPS